MATCRKAVCALLVLALSAAATTATIDGLGVNWGTITRRPLPTDTVVKLLQDNGITKVKLFDVDDTILNALANTEIEVMVAVPNLMLRPLGSYSIAEAWVKANVTRYTSKGVNITLVGVGNEPFLRDYNDTFTNVTFPALKNVQQALDKAGVGKTIKATIPLNADVYNSPLENPVPSAGMFRYDVADLMAEIVQFYNTTGAPFMVNIYPFLSYFSSPNFPLEFAFFDGDASPVIDNDGTEYTNVFDANHDTLVAALKGANVSNVPIIVGEVGWPTDGDTHANNTYAERFYKGLMEHLASKKGTPKRPNTTVGVYIFGLFDEDEKSVLPGNFERHWGILGADGKPKFPIDLSGGVGKAKDLVGAKDVEFLPNKWCVFDPNTKGNVSNLGGSMAYACDRADCTPIGNGSSCGGLDEHGKASYVFNQYFQATYQKVASCDFGGLAMVTTKDPSQGSCKFVVGFAPPPSPPPAEPPVDSGSHSGSPSHGKLSNSSSSGVAVVPSSALALVGLLSLFLY